MENLKQQMIDLIARKCDTASLIDVSDSVDEILKSFFVLKEHDFDSTIVDRGFTYLVKLKSGRLCTAWYNYHGQWMLNHPDKELAIDKIFTPRIR